MSKVVGSRVGAMQKADEKTVWMYGYGVYEGDKECPSLGGMLNPCIRLDNGKTVWGCECWWGSEEKVKATIAGRKVVEVDPPVYEVEDGE